MFFCHDIQSFCYPLHPSQTCGNVLAMQRTNPYGNPLTMQRTNPNGNSFAYATSYKPVLHRYTTIGTACVDAAAAIKGATDAHDKLGDSRVFAQLHKTTDYFPEDLQVHVSVGYDTCWVWLAACSDCSDFSSPISKSKLDCCHHNPCGLALETT